MVASPVFNTMLSGDFEEAKTAEVNLPGKRVEEVEWMLDFLYPDTECPLTGTLKTVNYDRIFFLTIIFKVLVKLFIQQNQQSTLISFNAQ